MVTLERAFDVELEEVVFTFNQVLYNIVVRAQNEHFWVCIVRLPPKIDATLLWACFETHHPAHLSRWMFVVQMEGQRQCPEGLHSLDDAQPSDSHFTSPCDKQQTSGRIDKQHSIFKRCFGSREQVKDVGYTRRAGTHIQSVVSVVKQVNYSYYLCY